MKDKTYLVIQTIATGNEPRVSFVISIVIEGEILCIDSVHTASIRDFDFEGCTQIFQLACSDFRVALKGSGFGLLGV
jgi:ABC-type polysaccharide/polyol phosphate transport system ATPase subunit